MNIFILSESPTLAATYQHDRHVVKMILESAQMLSSAIALNPELRLALDSYIADKRPSVPQLYKPTHVNHPCSIWARESIANFTWLTLHLDALVSEYHRRFLKVHKTDSLRCLFNGMVAYHCTPANQDNRLWMRDAERKLSLNQFVVEVAMTHTPFAICISNLSTFRDDDAIRWYRQYYVTDKIFQDHVKWTACEIPSWIQKYADSTHIEVNQRIAKLIRNNHIERFGPPPPPPIDPLGVKLRMVNQSSITA